MFQIGAGDLFWTLLQVCLFLGIIAIFIYQIYCWLRYESVPKMNVIALLLKTSPNDKWLLNPNDWIGIHKILSYMHISIPMLFAIFIFFYFYPSNSGEESEEIKRLQKIKGYFYQRKERIRMKDMVKAIKESKRIVNNTLKR